MTPGVGANGIAGASVSPYVCHTVPSNRAWLMAGIQFAIWTAWPLRCGPGPMAKVVVAFGRQQLCLLTLCATRSLGSWLEGAPSNSTHGVSSLLFVDSCTARDTLATEGGPAPLWSETQFPHL